jgi:hypothetical protein
MMDPPVMSRDPKPMASLMDFQQKGLHGPVWKVPPLCHCALCFGKLNSAGSTSVQERFLVCAKGKLAWFPPECAIEGYVEAKALGSIPVSLRRLRACCSRPAMDRSPMSSSR